MGRSIFPSHSLRVESFFHSREEKSLRAQKRIGTWRFLRAFLWWCEGGFEAIWRECRVLRKCITLWCGCFSNFFGSTHRRWALSRWFLVSLFLLRVAFLVSNATKSEGLHNEFLSSSSPTLPSVGVRNPTVAFPAMALRALSALCASMTWFLTLRHRVTHCVR